MQHTPSPIPEELSFCSFFLLKSLFLFRTPSLGENSPNFFFPADWIGNVSVWERGNSNNLGETGVFALSLVPKKRVISKRG